MDAENIFWSILAIVFIGFPIIGYLIGKLSNLFNGPKQEELDLARKKMEEAEKETAEAKVKAEEAQAKIDEYRALKENLVSRYNSRMNTIAIKEKLRQQQMDEIVEMRLSRIDDDVRTKVSKATLELEKREVDLKNKEADLNQRIKEGVLKELKTERNKLIDRENQLIEKENSLINNQNAYKKQLINLEEDMDLLIMQKFDSYPYLAGVMADLLTLHYEKSAEMLLKKKNPARVEAKRIRELSKETKQILAESKVREYKLSYIEKLFPNINDIFDSGFSEEAFELETEETTDRVRLFLSPEEYSNLTTAERNQLALDRYMQSRKSKWQIGRDYEMYIGYCIEQMGISVKYTGIIERLEDMGRDLIAEKGKSTYIIQCKNWSQEKIIHEKHVFQLYGTMILYKIEHPNRTVSGAFVASTNLSETAKKVAKELGIEVFEKVSLKDFPRIKCNINKTTKEKIYHLPFDQQYDHAVIKKKDGEFYALTVKEAEDAGFRRAMKHFV